MVKVLFTLGDWCIRDDSKTQPRQHATHKCADRSDYASWAWAVSDARFNSFVCFFCQDQVPDEIQALLVLLEAGIKP